MNLLLLILAEHKVQPFTGPLLTLGRQSVEGSHDDVLTAFTMVGIEPLALTPALQAPETPIDKKIFAHLGLESSALDVSDYEDADIIHDLNLPIDDEHANRFGTVLDSGTIEHVFNIRTGFANVSKLLAPGGRVMHITPCNNYVNHGFWQVSPTTFFDYYMANGFTNLKATMIVHPRDNYQSKPWLSFRYDPEVHGGVNSFFSSRDDQLTCMFSAEKTSASTSEVVPTQSYFVRLADLTKNGTTIRGGHYLLEYTDHGLNAEVQYYTIGAQLEPQTDGPAAVATEVP